MKINRVYVKNFRNIAETTLDTGGSSFVVVRGKNGQGKTSLSEAISLSLTETTWGLAKNGAGFAKKIRRNDPKATIEVDLQGAQRVIRRIVTLNVNSTGRTQKSEDLNDSDWVPKKFNDLLEEKKVALGIAINTRSFMGMVYARDEDAQKSLLAQLVLPVRYDFPKETVSDVEKILGEGVINFNAEPFTAIEQAYKKLHKEREGVNRSVKEFLIPAALPRPQGVDSTSLKSQLNSLREARTKWSSERDEAAKKLNEAAVKQARAKAKVETLEAVLRASKDALRELESNILPDPANFLLIAGRREECERLRGDLQRISRYQDVAKAEEMRVRELSKIGLTCPTCEQDIDDAKIVKLMTEAVAKRSQLTEDYENTGNKIYALGDVDGAIAKIGKHKEALVGKDEVSAKIEQQTKELEEVKAESSIGGLFDSSVFDSTLADTDRKIESILEQIQPVIAAEERDKEIATKKEQFKRLEDKATKLDGLVTYFDKNGIKAKLISQYIGSFEDKCNEVLKAWDYSCSLSIEPFKFEITDYRKVSTPLIELSGAEELMFYAAFQCAVSRTAGIGFVVIDKVDTLLPELRPKMYAHLYKMVSDKILDQVILLVADASEQVPKLDNSKFFMIEEGKIRTLGT